MTATRTHSTLLKRFRRDNRGAAMVEFAIIAPLLFALIFGIIDFGRVFFLYNNLTNAAREGARLGSVYPEDAGANVTTIRDATRARINDSNGSTATVNVTYQGAFPGRTVRVHIQNYPFTPVTFIVFGASRQLNVRAEFRLEQQS